jgi:hypothetical protein
MPTAAPGRICSVLSFWLDDYYRDLMTGTVLEAGEVTGIPVSAWQYKPGRVL